MSDDRMSDGQATIIWICLVIAFSLLGLALWAGGYQKGKEDARNFIKKYDKPLVKYPKVLEDMKSE